MDPILFKWSIERDTAAIFHVHVVVQGVKGESRKIFEFKIWKEPMLVLKHYGASSFNLQLHKDGVNNYVHPDCVNVS